MARAEQLRCNYRTGTAVFHDTSPYFSWSVADLAPGRWPRGHQVLVATRPALLAPLLADCWDSGMVDSGDCHETYGGRPLRSRDRCWWTVRVWEDSSAAGNAEFSEPSSFELGLLPEDWKAAWMGFAGQWYGQSLLMRLRITLDERADIDIARAYVASAGWHRLRVNGAAPDKRCARASRVRDLEACYLFVLSGRASSYTWTKRRRPSTGRRMARPAMCPGATARRLSRRLQPSVPDRSP